MGGWFEAHSWALIPVDPFFSDERMEPTSLATICHNLLLLYIPGPPLCSGSMLKFPIDHACSRQKCSNCWFLFMASEEPIARYCDQAIRIPSNHISEHENLSDPQQANPFFDLRPLAEICARFAGCNLNGLDQNTKDDRFWRKPLFRSIFIESRLAQIAWQEHHANMKNTCGFCL